MIWVKGRYGYIVLLRGQGSLSLESRDVSPVPAPFIPVSNFRPAKKASKMLKDAEHALSFGGGNFAWKPHATHAMFIRGSPVEQRSETGCCDDSTGPRHLSTIATCIIYDICIVLPRIFFICTYWFPLFSVVNLCEA